MPNIFVDQLNFEFEESNSFHDILLNSGAGTPSLSETVVSIAHIYVDILNLEIPVSAAIADVCTNTGTGTHTCDEEIIGTPIPEPEQPEVVVGGGTGGRIQVMGGRPWSEEDIYAKSSSMQLIGEQILIGELVEAYAYNDSDIDTKIRRPIYAKPRAVEILSFSPVSERTIVIPKEPVEEPKINLRQKDEEELLLLGII